MRGRSSLQTLARGLEVLQLLSNRPYSVEELGRELGCPLSTTYRLVTTLRRLGFVERDPRERRYTLGFAILGLGRALINRLSIRQMAASTLRDLARSLDETVVLTVHAGNFGVAVETIESMDPVRVAPVPGERVPLHIGAPMKAILAFLPSEEIEAYLRHPLEGLTPKSITDPGRLRHHLRQIRERGYAESWEEVYAGAVGVAVPILGPEGYAVGSLAVAGPVHRSTAEGVRAVAQRLLPAGKEVTRRLQASWVEESRIPIPRHRARGRAR